MRFSIMLVVAGLAALPAARSHAEAGGCLKYGAAGALAGHAVGHGVKGAAAGCATGMAVRHEARKTAAANAAAGRLATGGMHGAIAPR